MYSSFVLILESRIDCGKSLFFETTLKVIWNVISLLNFIAMFQANVCRLYSVASLVNDTDKISQFPHLSCYLSGAACESLLRLPYDAWVHIQSLTAFRTVEVRCYSIGSVATQWDNVQMLKPSLQQPAGQSGRSGQVGSSQTTDCRCKLADMASANWSEFNFLLCIRRMHFCASNSNFLVNFHHQEI